MDTVTHAMAGYLLAETGLNKGTGKWGSIAGVVASVFPDIDLLLGAFTSTEFMIRFHRNLTNSVFLAIPFSLLLAWVLVKFSRIRKFRDFFLICLTVILVHDFLDVLTSYGTMVLSPFSKARFSVDWLFIVDPYFTSILALGILGIWMFKNKARILAGASFTMLCLYIGLCGMNHFQALSLAKEYAEEHHLEAQTVVSLPQPASPFFWSNYIVTGAQVYLGRVDLLASSHSNPGSDKDLVDRFLPRYQSIPDLQYKKMERFERSPWVEKALDVKDVRMYLWFARFPIGRYKKSPREGCHRVLFYDLRFSSFAGKSPFVYEVVFDQEGSVMRKGFLE